MLVRDQITGEHGKIGLHGINQVDGTPERCAGHEVPDVDIAEMDDAQPIQTGWQVRQRDLTREDTAPQHVERRGQHDERRDDPETLQ